MPWLKDREVAAIGFDGDSDVEPCSTEGTWVPIDVLRIIAMGLHFFDCLDLDQFLRGVRGAEALGDVLCCSPASTTGRPWLRD